MRAGFPCNENEFSLWECGHKEYLFSLQVPGLQCRWSDFFIHNSFDLPKKKTLQPNWHYNATNTYNSEFFLYRYQCQVGQCSLAFATHISEMGLNGTTYSHMSRRNIWINSKPPNNIYVILILGRNWSISCYFWNIWQSRFWGHWGQRTIKVEFCGCNLEISES